MDEILCVECQCIEFVPASTRDQSVHRQQKMALLPVVTGQHMLGEPGNRVSCSDNHSKTKEEVNSKKLVNQR